MSRADSPAAATAARRPLRRSVYGFYPYWGGDWTATRFDLMSSLAVFGVDLDSNGNISNRHGWGTPTQNALVMQAKQAGVKVSVAVVNFTAASLSTLLADPARRQNAIDRIMEEVARGGAEGVAIDFETLPAPSRGNFVTFTTDLAARLRSEIPDAELAVATPAVDWSSAYDYVRLAAVADALFIMGYDYYYSGGPPGPVAPLQSGMSWGTHNLQATLRDYLRLGGQGLRAKIILGLPWYGRNWPALGPGIPGRRGVGNSTSVLYRDAGALLAMYPRQWDPESMNPYLVWQDATGWRQVFYDDRESFGAKLDLAETENLRGVGFWALTYERGTTDLWEALEERFAGAVQPPDAGVPPDSGSAPDRGVPDDGSTLGPDAVAAGESDAGFFDAAEGERGDAKENAVEVDATSGPAEMPPRDPGASLDAPAREKHGCGCQSAPLGPRGAAGGPRTGIALLWFVLSSIASLGRARRWARS